MRYTTDANGEVFVHSGVGTRALGQFAIRARAPSTADTATAEDVLDPGKLAAYTKCLADCARGSRTPQQYFACIKNVCAQPRRTRAGI